MLLLYGLEEEVCRGKDFLDDDVTAFEYKNVFRSFELGLFTRRSRTLAS